MQHIAGRVMARRIRGAQILKVEMHHVVACARQLQLTCGAQRSDAGTMQRVSTEAAVRTLSSAPSHVHCHAHTFVSVCAPV